MSNKTIAKFYVLVILILVVPAFMTSCSHATPSGRSAVNTSEVSLDYEKPRSTGRIESSDVNESSGVASSLCQTDVFWTHNDSGDDSYIFAFDSKGKDLGTWRVTNARNLDWEDMASYKDGSGTCYLYIGDIGNNKLEKAEQQIYRVKEPSVSTEPSSKKNPLATEPAESAVFKYVDRPHDAETMMVNQQTGDVYVLTKRVDGPSLVFKFKPEFGSGPVKAEKVGEVSLPAVPNGLMTGGAISPDGTRVVLCDYSSGYELSLKGSASFDDIWKQNPVPIDLGDRKQGEAVTFSADGRSIIATSEKKNSPIIDVKRK